MKVTQAVILAAGRGSRLGDLTEAKPKCLTELAGRTLLAWQLDALRAAGIADIAIVTGYRPNLLEGMGCTTFHNHRWDKTNMVASAACAGAWLERRDTIIAYSDIVYRPQIVRALAESPGDVAITYDRDWHALWSARLDDPLSDAETFREVGGRLVEIGDRPRTLQDVHGQYMGLLRVTPRGWQTIKDAWDFTPPERHDRLDMTGLLRQLLARGERVRTVPIDGGWCEVDSPQDLASYERALATGTWSHDWREPVGF